MVYKIGFNKQFIGNECLTIEADNYDEVYNRFKEVIGIDFDDDCFIEEVPELTELMDKHRALWQKVIDILRRGNPIFFNQQQLDELSFNESSDSYGIMENLRDSNNLSDLIKIQAFIELGEKNIPINLCYACDYCTYCIYYCFDCPLSWEHGHCNVGSEYYEFRKAMESEDWQVALEWANKIANLPLREDLYD